MTTLSDDPSAQALAREVDQRTVPLLVAPGSSRSGVLNTVRGSGVLVSIGPGLFLFTAEHLLEGMSPADQFLIGETRLACGQDTGRGWHVSIPPGAGWTSKEHDAAALQVICEEAEGQRQLERMAIPLSQVCPGLEGRPWWQSRIVALTGCPVALDHESSIAQFTYLTGLAGDDESPLPEEAHWRRHPYWIWFSLSLSNSAHMSDASLDYTIPLLGGASGGGIWARPFDGSTEAALVGIHLSSSVRRAKATDHPWAIAAACSTMIHLKLLHDHHPGAAQAIESQWPNYF